MDTQRTDAEWEEVIQDVEKRLPQALGSGYAIDGATDVHGKAFAQTIDHTLLKLDASASGIDELCAEARTNGFATVCVRPQWVQQCVDTLQHSNVKVASVIGFHEGTYDLSSKVRETNLAIHAGAHELDMVLNYSHLIEQCYSTVYHELATVRAQAPHPVVLKLILETSQLNRAQIVAACVLAAAAEFDFVKTSTGFNGPGATLENVRLMRACSQITADRSDHLPGRTMQVKASGGIRSLDLARAMLRAGASRLGTSSGVALVQQEARERRGEDVQSSAQAAEDGLAAATVY